jgi:Zn-dependent peptidase ImmA (M78 family)
MAAAMAGAPKFEIRTIMVPATVATVVRGEDGELKSPDRIMRSVLQRYRTSAIIRLLDNLNPCWTRFVICKELAHLIMGEANGARAQNMREQITMAYEIGKSARPDADLSGEQFAWFVAAELMLPIQDRDEFVRRMRSNEDRMSIARSYWVPKAVIDLFSETPYGEVSSSLIGA